MLRCNDLCTIYSMRLNRREAFFSMQCMAVGAILLSRINGCSQTKGFATVQLVLLSDTCVFAHLFLCNLLMIIQRNLTSMN